MANQKEVNEIIREKLVDVFIKWFENMGATNQRVFIEALEGLMEENAIRPEEVSRSKSENSA